MGVAATVAPAVQVSVKPDDEAHMFLVTVRADTTVGPKWIAVRIERDMPKDEALDRMVMRLACPLVRVELPRPQDEEIERRMQADDKAWFDARSAQVQARREQYAAEITPRLIEALVAV